MNTILIVDNRQAYKKIASLFPDSVVTWAPDLAVARKLLMSSAFDVIICPIEIGEDSVFELLRHMNSQRGVKTKVLCWLRLTKALSRFRNSLMDAAVALGVSGFIGEETDDYELAQSILRHFPKATSEIRGKGQLADNGLQTGS